MPSCLPYSFFKQGHAQIYLHYGIRLRSNMTIAYYSSVIILLFLHIWFPGPFKNTFSHILVFISWSKSITKFCAFTNRLHRSFHHYTLRLWTDSVYLLRNTLTTSALSISHHYLFNQITHLSWVPTMNLFHGSTALLHITDICPFGHLRWWVV